MIDRAFCLSTVQMSKQMAHLVRHRVTEPLKRFIVLMPAWPQRGVYRDRALLHFGPHLDNGVLGFRARDRFVLGVGELMSAHHDCGGAAGRDAMPVALGEPQRERHGVCCWVSCRLVSSSRCRQEQRRCQDDREQKTAHALHADGSGAIVLPPGGVISGGATGE